MRMTSLRTTIFGFNVYNLHQDCVWLRKLNFYISIPTHILRFCQTSIFSSFHPLILSFFSFSLPSFSILLKRLPL